MAQQTKIALGGGCHWCTEAVFQSLKGVQNVEQCYIASTDSNNVFSEAAIVHFDANKISLKTLIEIHLHTHKSTVAHSMRSKYRSAVYAFDETDITLAKESIRQLQAEFKEELITQVLPFHAFKPSDTRFHNYYFSDTEKPFCKTYIAPKLKLILEKFSDQANGKAQLQ